MKSNVSKIENILGIIDNNNNKYNNYLISDLLAPPRAGSARSSLSEMSGASGTSTGTYLHEASTLVLETTENNAKK